MIFAWMPWVFMFMLGRFASGLVIYWCANNIITFTQQYLIMRSQGAQIDLLGNITSGFKKKPAVVATAKPPAKVRAEVVEDDADEDAPAGSKPKAKAGKKPAGKPSRKRPGKGASKNTGKGT
jgi:YidC/Oxa1 family membrane protein insertase